eukprot:15482689-Alexandrium_andersonii.AAC.1
MQQVEAAKTDFCNDFFMMDTKELEEKFEADRLFVLVVQMCETLLPLISAVGYDCKLLLTQSQARASVKKTYPSTLSLRAGNVSAKPRPNHSLPQASGPCGLQLAWQSVGVFRPTSSLHMPGYAGDR